MAPPVLEILQMLYNREPIPFQTLSFPQSSQQATHSDRIHFSSVPERFFCAAYGSPRITDIRTGKEVQHYWPVTGSTWAPRNAASLPETEGHRPCPVNTASRGLRALAAQHRVSAR